MDSEGERPGTALFPATTRPHSHPSVSHPPHYLQHIHQQLHLHFISSFLFHFPNSHDVDVREEPSLTVLPPPPHTPSPPPLTSSQAAATIQILEAEKVLFRALREKKPTPQYGLVYSSSLSDPSITKHKGKISRVLAAKTALAVRMDSLGDVDLDDEQYEREIRARLNSRLAAMEADQN